jgi:P-type Ca2+ transporter type 2C
VDENEARTLAIVALTAGNLALVWVNASEGVGSRALVGRAFGAFWAVAAVATAALAAAMFVPPLRTLLHFGLPSAAALALALGGVLASVALFVGLSRLVQGRRVAAGAASFG